MKNRKYRFFKLSEDMPEASLKATKRKLAELKQLVEQGIIIREDLSEIVAKLRQVAAPPDEPFLFTTSLDDNKKLLEDAFQECGDVKFRSFSTVWQQNALMIYLEGMTDIRTLNESVLPYLMRQNYGEKSDSQSKQFSQINGATDIKDFVRNLPIADVAFLEGAEEAIESVMNGKVILVFDGLAEVLSTGAVKFVKRGIEEPKSESNIRGPHDSFSETLQDNIALMRRRTRDNNLKVKIIKIGIRSKTPVAVLYIEDLVKPGLVKEVMRRLATVERDIITTSYNIEELIVDHPWTPFPQIQSSERPEKIISAIYEGRVAILVDTTPAALMVPCTYISIMQSTDDYTQSPTVASLLRIVRHVSAFIAIYLPAVYIGIVSYNSSILPTTLAISIAELRAKTPFPSFLEALMMEALLEMLQEALVQLPARMVGGASIVGGFVIGTTVVQAGLINPLLVVVIAVTAIASYTMVFYNFGLATRVLRILMIILASTLGLYGVVLGAIVITVYLCSVRSFGESYLGGMGNLTLLEDWKDTILRLPQRFSTGRPKEYGSQHRKRGDMKDG